MSSRAANSFRFSSQSAATDSELEPNEPLAPKLAEHGGGWVDSIDKIAAALLGVALTELRYPKAEAERREERLQCLVITFASGLRQPV